jgi:hypothetical protein
VIVTCRASDLEYTTSIIDRAIRIAKDVCVDRDDRVFVEDKDGYRVQVFPGSDPIEISNMLQTMRTMS